MKKRLLAKARRDYEAKIKAVVNPITAANMKKLDEMKKAYGAKGDLVSAQAVQKEIDSLSPTKPVLTILGKWAWVDRVTVEFLEDGTVKNSGGITGKWTCLDKKMGNYRVSWSDGGFDWMQMSRDGSALACKNNRDRIWTGQRLPEP